MDFRPVLGHRLEFCTLYCVWYKHLLWLKKARWLNFSFTFLFPSNFTLEIQIGILGFLNFRTPIANKNCTWNSTVSWHQWDKRISNFKDVNFLTFLLICLPGLQGSPTSVICSMHVDACIKSRKFVLAQKNHYNHFNLPGSGILLPRISGLYFALKLWLLDTLAC